MLFLTDWISCLLTSLSAGTWGSRILVIMAAHVHSVKLEKMKGTPLKGKGTIEGKVES
jgi:hypothetical protein